MNKYIIMHGEEIWINDSPDGMQYIFTTPASSPEIIEKVEQDIYAIDQKEPPVESAYKINIRTIFEQSGAEAFHLAGCARQLLFWRKTHRYCGACGRGLSRVENERAMHCSSCSLFFYPRINPVVITLIHKGDSILLARRADPGFNHFWSVVAGFVEAGESLENAVKREINEEVGLKVRNIRCIASQQWPFPNNLMIGFYAEYESGTIKPDGEEIAEAGWFTKETLPRIPSKVSIARHLIDSFFEDSGCKHPY